uniref:Uncharacterized protein n=1 Tax=Acrobeloides nanus TaxID=290746 RepID=A0A914EFG2_9BILA
MKGIINRNNHDPPQQFKQRVLVENLPPADNQEVGITFGTTLYGQWYALVVIWSVGRFDEINRHTIYMYTDEDYFDRTLPVEEKPKSTFIEKETK